MRAANAVRGEYRVDLPTHPLTSHRFLGLASTTLIEQGFNPDRIERRLVQSERDEERAADNDAQCLPEPRKMMHGGATICI
jgi:hypothetical protein